MSSVFWAHILSSWPWYLVRACGLVSAVLLVFLIISGIGLITGFTFRFWAPIKAWAVHKAIGITLVFALFGHIFFLLLDKYQKYTLKMILIPSSSSFWLALGILAMYFLGIVIVSSLTLINSKKKMWKVIHFLNYVTVAFIFFHALNMGTDLRSGLLRAVWILVGLITLVAMIIRFLRSRMIKN
jgi:predicted ferric reductase